MKLENIIYLYGYKGENSVKYEILKEYFQSKYNVLKIIQYPEPYQNIQIIEQQIIPDKSFIIGSSLGGFYSLYLSLKLNVPALLINPSFNPDLGQLRKEFPELYLNQFSAIKDEIKDYITKKSSFNIDTFLANDDELLDHSELIKLFNFKNMPIHYFDNKKHGFLDFADDMDLVQNIINKYEI